MVPNGLRMLRVVTLCIGPHFHATSQRELNGSTYKTESARMQSAYGRSSARKRDGYISLGKILIMPLRF